MCSLRSTLPVFRFEISLLGLERCACRGVVCCHIFLYHVGQCDLDKGSLLSVDVKIKAGLNE